ncbi:MAG TPA: glycosyltransferase [bacterium]|nr:glycosyltransferase [bacterium]
MKPVSVGLFCDSYAPVVDGVTTTVRNYADWLSKSLGPTTVVTPSAPGHTDDESFSVIRYLSMPTFLRPPYRIGLPHLDIRLARTLAASEFSIIHAHSPFGAGHIALETARKHGIPIVATLHSKYRDDLQRSLPIGLLVDREIRHIVDFFYAVDQVWVPQKSVAATLREYGYKGPYEVIENGIDLEPPADVDPYRVRGQLELGISQDTLMGLYVGQHTLEKNLEFLVRSLPAVIDALPEFRMIFVGVGYAKERLKEIVAELGIAGRVTFRESIRDREILKTVYARADLFLFPSFYDTSGLVVREAAAFMTPALLIAGSDAAEVIDDERNGFLSANDSDAFSSRVIQVLKDHDLRNRVGIEAQKTLCRSWRHVVNEVQDRYSAILAGRS